MMGLLLARVGGRRSSSGLDTFRDQFRDEHGLPHTDNGRPRAP